MFRLDLRHSGRAVALAIAGLLLSSSPEAFAADANDSDESWQVIHLAGKRIGYGRVVIRKVSRERDTIFITDAEEHVSIRRFGQQLRIQSKTHTEETEDGQLLSFSFEMKNPPAQSTSSSGRVEGRNLVIETTVGGQVQTKKLEWDSTIKSPAWQERSLSDSPLKPGESRSFKTFMPEFTKVVTVKMSAQDYRVVKLHDGTEKSLLKVNVTQSILPGIGMRVYLDSNGEALRTEADLLGMVTYSVPREVALQQIAGAELDVATNTLIRVASLPVGLHDRTKAVYRIQTKGRNPSEFLPTGETQTVAAIDDETATLTVSAIRPPQNIRPSRNEQLDYLGETQFLQAKDARVQEHARRAAAGSTDPGTIAVRMEQYVYKELKKKNFSTALASAAEVARSLEGDCTEHACLLAAMLRVENIPSRVAVGLVYAESLGAFGGHMWTEAWLDGKWVPLDATLGKGGIGPGHIKLADSSLSDDGPAPVTSFIPLMNMLSGVTIDVVSTE
ncbi:MAG: transglutaminase domain-containing protein [Rhodopirellula sp.]|nr:transglutaminase domain-containing protein [Rhodopirellula sp.]